VQRISFHLELHQRVSDLVAQSLRVAEHHRLAGAGGHCGDDAVFVHPMHRQKQVPHRAHRGGRSVDRHFARVVHVAAHEVADLAVERGGKQHRLVRARHLAQHPLHLGHESFVGHAVGLVDHDHLHVGEGELVFLQQIDEPQRGGHHDLGAGLEGRDLVVARRTAVHRQHAAVAVAADGLEHLGDLQGEFAGGHQDEPARGAHAGGSIDAGEHRHPERERLARAGAGAAAEVDAGESDGNRLGLDGKGCGESGGGEPGIHARRHAECGELRGLRHDFVQRYLRRLAPFTCRSSLDTDS